VSNLAILADASVAISARDLNGIACLSIQFSISVRVLLEVAVNAMHAFFQMNVLQLRRLKLSVTAKETCWMSRFP